MFILFPFWLTDSEGGDDEYPHALKLKEKMRQERKKEVADGMVFPLAGIPPSLVFRQLTLSPLPCCVYNTELWIEMP